MKHLSLLLASALALSTFVGCAQEGGSTSGGSTPSSSTSGSSSSSSSSNYPSRGITWISSAEAGSLSDSLSRDVTEFIDLGGQKALVTNMPGGSQSVALTAIAQADPDGYTMGGGGYSGLLTQPIQQNVPYSLDDFRFVASTQAPWSVTIMATASSGLTSWEDVVAAANNGDDIIYSTGITGSGTHLAMLQMMQESGINLKYVPYSGTTEVDAALEGNHIQLAILPTSASAISKFESGQLVPLVHFEPDGIECFPEVPSASEYGVDPTNYINHDIMIVPKDTPDEIYDYLKGQIDAMLQTQEYIERRQMSGNDGVTELMTEEELTEMLYAARDVYQVISEEAGLIMK